MKKISFLILIIILIATALFFFTREEVAAPTPAPVTNTTPTTTKTFTLNEVKSHASQTDCWTTIRGKVYDITSYVPRHPGGIAEIMQVCGKDGSTLFDDQHGDDRKPDNMLSKFVIGALSK